MSITDARAKLPNLIDRVDKNLERVTITVKGQPKAVIVSSEELESLEETAEILSTPNIKRELEKSRKQFKKGEFILLSDLK